MIYPAPKPSGGKRAPKGLKRTRMKSRPGGKAFKAVRDPAHCRWVVTETPCVGLGRFFQRRISVADYAQGAPDEYDALLVRVPAPQGDAAPKYPMGALEAALRGLGCQCGGDVDGHEASEHLTPGEREVFEQVEAAYRIANEQGDELERLARARGGASSSGSAPEGPSVPTPTNSAPASSSLVIAGSCPPAPSPEAIEAGCAAHVANGFAPVDDSLRAAVRIILEAAYRLDRESPMGSR